jgi:hypothetical protein
LRFGVGVGWTPSKDGLWGLWQCSAIARLPRSVLCPAAGADLVAYFWVTISRRCGASSFSYHFALVCLLCEASVLGESLATAASVGVSNLLGGIVLDHFPLPCNLEARLLIHRHSCRRFFSPFCAVPVPPSPNGAINSCSCFIGAPANSSTWFLGFVLQFA